MLSHRAIVPAAPESGERGDDCCPRRDGPPILAGRGTTPEEQSRMGFLFGFAYYGGLLWVALALAWVGYEQRKRRPGFNRWYIAACVSAALGAAAWYVLQQMGAAMRSAGG
ncbi:hypothetical protein [Lysobacter sp. Root690]|uniref:hypothetical protein n=1 Tax=Lysobacter sp. Root690 TaxID=1736588 RepID=UPI0012FAEA76|nr:hypothetical protein [Lysobacter sp. Root690]